MESGNYQHDLKHRVLSEKAADTGKGLKCTPTFTPGKRMLNFYQIKYRLCFRLGTAADAS